VIRSISFQDLERKKDLQFIFHHLTESSISKMPGRPSPPPESSISALPRVSLRWDTAQRACRDGDLKTLKFLFESAQLFEDKEALREACISGAWGTGREDLLQRAFSTTDSIRLHTTLLHATERGHVRLIRYILQIFPAKQLHVTEWQIVVNAISKGNVELLEPFVEIDPDLVNMVLPSFGSCFTILFGSVEEKELHLPVVEYLIDKGADIKNSPNVWEDCAASSTAEVFRVLQSAGANGDAGLALCIAAYHNNTGVVELLLGKGEDVNEIHEAGCAIQRRRNNAVPIAEKGTPLYYAAAGRQPNVFRLLLRKGAVAEIAASDGKTALDIAQEMRYEEFLAISRESGM
jgi:hypothetical protein